MVSSRLFIVTPPFLLIVPSTTLKMQHVFSLISLTDLAFLSSIFSTVQGTYHLDIIKERYLFSIKTVGHIKKSPHDLKHFAVNLRPTAEYLSNHYSCPISFRIKSAHCCKWQPKNDPEGLPISYSIVKFWKAILSLQVEIEPQKARFKSRRDRQD